MTCHRPSRLDLRIGPCRGTGHRRAPLAAPLALAGLLAASGGAATAQEAALFPIERGDVLAVTVLDEPSLSREAKVDALGRIMLPQIGSVSIAGHDLDQVRELIEAELSGRDILVDPQVIVEVASYRPIYVGGAVDTQGAVPFEPGLTVRHALLLAGGVERKDGMAELTDLELVELRSEWAANAFALLEVESRIARLQAELEHRAEADIGAISNPGVAEEDAVAVTSLDSALLADRLQIRSADRTHLRDLMDVTNVELDVLAKQSAQQELESRLQQQELRNAQTLMEKGLMSQVRVRELERERSQLSRNILDVQAYTARAQQNKETIDYELEAADREWRIETRALLREAVLERTHLQAESERLAATMVAAGIHLTGNRPPPDPKVVIHRRSAGSEETFQAGMETEIMPGDILDVSIDASPQG